jgi:hypothetical protein
MSDFATLQDVARRSGDPKASAMIEVLNKKNSMLDDIPWVQCNNGTTHITTLRTSLPKPVWRMLNAGVPKGKSTSKQITAHCGMLESYAEVDEKLVKLAQRNGGQQGAANFLASENKAWIEGFGQEISRVIFYGDNSKPQEPVGLIHYYNKIGNISNETNVIDAGGTTANDNTSIWLVNWGPDSIHGLYPQGTTAGLSEDYLGVHTVKDEDGNQFQAHRTHYSWDAGLVVRDWRMGARIANIDVEAMLGQTDAAANILKLLTLASYKMPSTASSGRAAFYMRKEILTLLDIQVQNKANLQLTYDTVAGKKVLTFRGIPLREQETLSLKEKLVK